ncbi:hypothetical protein GH810_11880 [Acetobacterium paludosum]|uniref:Uncharacterized protein n=1 Tax=Acetobacterium paludosum TaxID=52693 RepID=A0A923HUW9_9FIRM|nr:hypothetical protein [Acetobacterium paludosum]MBC3889013.1 hypothetical protein [Acetobacterium paludosum]
MMKSDQIKQHEHGENCECGCHDEHHDEHHHHEHKPITITIHDMSVVGSYTFSIAKSYQESETILDDLLKQAAKKVTDLGGIIGHIKAFLKSEGESCMISITDDESNKRYVKESQCTVEGVAIVFCIEPEQLQDILENVFKEYISE